MSIFLSSEDDKQLISNGYEPIPIEGKAAVSQAWQTGSISIERIRAMREVYPEARGTGLRTGRLVAVDIDIPDVETTKAICTLAEDVLGETPLWRFGSKGMMLLYQTETPFRKISIVTDVTDKVEILSTGLQIAAFGIHPTTEKPYGWIKQTIEDSPASPLNTPLEILPEVFAGHLHTFTNRCRTLLLGLGYGAAEIRKAYEGEKTKREAGAEEDSAANIGRAIEHINGMVRKGHVAVIGQFGNDTIYELACLLRDRFYLSHQTIEDLMLEHWYPHCVPNTLVDECKQIISHAISYIQNEPGARAAPPAAEAFRDALGKLPEPTAPEGPKDLGEAQTIILQDENYDNEDTPTRASDYIGREFPPLRELVPIWCERNTNTFLEGPAATQKSRAALQDAICISAGIPVLGQSDIEQSDCIYLNYENSPEEMARRVHSICNSLRLTSDSAPINPEGVHIWELRKHPRPILICSRDGVKITRFGRRFLHTIATRRNTGKHSLVIFDGLMDAIIFNDNTRNDDAMAMGIIRTLDSWCVEYDFTAYSIVHPSRSSERGGTAGSYATAWTTKPRAIQTFKRVLSPYAGGGPKAKITEDTPIEDIWFQRRVQKRSNGPEGDRMLLEYWRGGLRPHPPAQKLRALPPPDDNAPELANDVAF
jgi:RecA-family ATPase